MNTLVFRSAAKINLNLQVLGRRPDGYHEIFTTFQAIDLYDTLVFERTASGGIRIESANPEFPTGSDNLIDRVLTEAAKLTDEPINVRVVVDKRIPIAAGLGGGSSNAAATLKAVNTLYELSLSDSDLIEWAKRLGADVPFFLGNAQAEGRGRGDLLRSIDFFADYWVALIKPPVSLSAAEVYQAEELCLTKNQKRHSFVYCREEKEFFFRVARSENALTAPVLRLCPEAGRALRFLEEHRPVAAMVSGSGSCVFGIFRVKPNLVILRRVMPSAEWQVFICRPLAGQAAVGLESRTGYSTDK